MIVPYVHKSALNDLDLQTCRKLTELIRVCEKAFKLALSHPEGSILESIWQVRRELGLPSMCTSIMVPAGECG
jgi:hypothetical protein